jgi:hypothetical protein
MSQTISTLVTGETHFSEIYGIINQNITTIRSQFSGGAQPNNPQPGQPFFNTSNEFIYIWTGSQWKDYSEVSPAIIALTAEILAARGSAPSLASRLAVALNDDGTLKGNAPVGSWWLLDTNTVSKSMSDMFISNGDARAIYEVDRAVKLVDSTLNSTYSYVKTAVYTEGTNITTVTTYDEVVPDGLSEVYIGQPLYNSPRSYIYQLPEIILSGPSSGNEGEDATITISNYDSTQDYIISVTGGTYSRVDDIITWTLPDVDLDTNYALSIYTVKSGYIRSVDTVHDINVLFVPIQDGPTVIFSNNTEAWPSATIVAGIIDVPAYSVGATNTNQIVNATPEITVTSNDIVIHIDTSDILFKSTSLIYNGMYILTDVGNFYADSVVNNESTVTPVTADWTSGTGLTINNDSISNGSGSSSAYGSFLLGDFVVEFIVPIQTSNELGVGVLGVSDIPLFDLQAAAQFAGSPMGGGNFGMTTLAGIAFNGYECTAYQNDLGSQGSSGTATTSTILSFERNGSTITFAIDGVVKHTYSLSVTEDMVFYVGAYGSSAQTVNNIEYTVTQDWSCVTSLPSAPTVAFSSPAQGEIISIETGTSSTTLKTTNLVENGQEFDSDQGEFTAGSVTYVDPIYTVDISAAGLSAAPSYVSRKTNPMGVAIGETTDTFTESDYDKISATHTPSVSGTVLKLTGSRIEFVEDPNLKQIALAVKEPSNIKFKDGTIYIQEKP